MLEELERPRAEQVPPGNDGDAISQHLSLGHVMGGEHNGPAASLLTQEVPDLLASKGVNAGCWFIQNDGAGFAHKSQQDGQLPLCSAGQVPSLNKTVRCHVHLLKPAGEEGENTYLQQTMCFCITGLPGNAGLSHSS